MIKKLRRITLQHQGLATTSPFGKGPEATLRVLEQLGYIQVDSLSVVVRAHHHTLWNRVPDYQTNYLSLLVEQRRAFEYWYHAASYLPMSHYRFVLPQMSAIKRGERSYYSHVDKKYIRHVIERITVEGPLKARDFKSSTKNKTTWWNWKPAKQALETLFIQGELMISGRNGMEKIYDLRERVLPDEVDTSEPSLSEFSEYLIGLTVQAYGFTTLNQLCHLRTGALLRQALETALQQMLEDGSLQKLKVDGMPAVYTTQDILESKVSRTNSRVRLLSPFDNAIIHRDRVWQLFGFDYKLECYTPKDKRRFGYFCLPILFQDNFVGRVDCKAHRDKNEFELINLHVDSDTLDLEKFIPNFKKAVNRFSAFNECRSIRVSNVFPKKAASLFKKAISTPK